MAKLSDTRIRKAKPSDKAYKLYDTAGLFMIVNPNGGKWWRFRYKYAGRSNSISMGTYPDVTLRQARERRDAARKQLADGINPSQARKAEQAVGTFRALAEEWQARYRGTWTSGTAATIKARLDKHALPWLGDMKPNDITAPDVLAVLRRMEHRGALETARKVRQYIGQVFRYGVASGQALADPTPALKGAIAPPKAKHRAAITEPAKLAELLRAMDGFSGTFTVGCALRLLPLLLLRPGELRKLEWTDITGDQIKLSGERMKMSRPHLVPLPDQALAILEELRPLTGHGRYVFPSIRSHACPMSENTLNAALRRLGYGKDEVTAHGFRTTASTLLHEQGFPSEQIELQLAHVDRNSIRATYNHAEHLDARRDMLQAWADYLDGLKHGADVVAIRSKSA